MTFIIEITTDFDDQPRVIELLKAALMPLTLPRQEAGIFRLKVDPMDQRWVSDALNLIHGLDWTKEDG